MLLHMRMQLHTLRSSMQALVGTMQILAAKMGCAVVVFQGRQWSTPLVTQELMVATRELVAQRQKAEDEVWPTACMRSAHQALRA